MPTWDEAKRRSNVKDHGLDFHDCDAIFDQPTVSWDDDRVAYGEQRISLRKAEKHEVKRYIKEISR